MCAIQQAERVWREQATLNVLRRSCSSASGRVHGALDLAAPCKISLQLDLARKRASVYGV